MGVETLVKNQGQCGLWQAFPTTDSLEGAGFIATRSVSPLSEQQLVDCVTVDSGCNGMFMDNGLLSSRRVPRARTSCSYTAVKGTWKGSCYTVGIAQGRVTRCKNVFTVR